MILLWILGKKLLLGKINKIIKKNKHNKEEKKKKKVSSKNNLHATDDVQGIEESVFINLMKCPQFFFFTLSFYGKNFKRSFGCR